MVELSGDVLLALGAIAGSLLTGGIQILRDTYDDWVERERLRRALLSELSMIAVPDAQELSERAGKTPSTPIYSSDIDNLNLLTQKEIQVIVVFYDRYRVIAEADTDVSERRVNDIRYRNMEARTLLQRNISSTYRRHVYQTIRRKLNDDSYTLASDEEVDEFFEKIDGEFDDDSELIQN